MDNPSIRCNLCNHKSDTFAHLRTHLQTFHEDCIIGHECFFCNKLLKNAYEHKEHLRRRHGDHCDFTTPPPTGRIDPRKQAKRPVKYLPPPEARTMPKPPKRRRSEPKASPILPPPTPVPFDLDAILAQDLQISDEDTQTPTLDKAIQVRRRDFLTTSRDIQATVEMVNEYTQVKNMNNTKEMGTQTVSTTNVCTTQTMTLTSASKSIQTQTASIRTSVEASTQVSFFNAGWITRHLTEAIRAIAPTLLNDPMSLSSRSIGYIQPNITQPVHDARTSRRGRPQPNTQSNNN